MKQRVVGRRKIKTNATEIYLACVSLLSLYFVYHIWSKDNPPSSNTTKRLTYALDKQNHGSIAATVAITATKIFELPPRIKNKIKSKDYIGGKKFGEMKNDNVRLDKISNKIDETIAVTQKPRMNMEEIISYLEGFITELSSLIKSKNKWTAIEVWEAYSNLTYHTLYKWDQDYLERMPERRLDDSLYFSLVSYRDENCFSTISNAFEKAERPEKLFVGLVQQNCVKDCKGAGLKVSYYKCYLSFYFGTYNSIFGCII